MYLATNALQKPFHPVHNTTTNMMKNTTAPTTDPAATGIIGILPAI
jgi:hypothetical protein